MLRTNIEIRFFHLFEFSLRFSTLEYDIAARTVGRGGVLNRGAAGPIAIRLRGVRGIGEVGQ